jgi:SAM-dependent methyltransferase
MEGSMEAHEHWNSVYRSKPEDGVSWFQPEATHSLDLITRSVGADAAVVDVGGGASTLVDGLLARRQREVTVLDISEAALDVAKRRLGERAALARWIAGDIRTVTLPRAAFDVWHDRAVFHFLMDPADRAAYVRQVARAVRPGGHVIVATFAPDGPDKCSGLPVRRYAPGELHREFGASFELVEHLDENHRTPWGAVQHFVYCHCILH